MLVNRSERITHQTPASAALIGIESNPITRIKIAKKRTLLQSVRSIFFNDSN